MILNPAIRALHDEFGNAPGLLSRVDRLAIENGTWFRASGECVCSACGSEYWRHGHVTGALWLHRICDGSLVKL